MNIKNEKTLILGIYMFFISLSLQIFIRVSSGIYSAILGYGNNYTLTLFMQLTDLMIFDILLYVMLFISVGLIIISLKFKV